MNWKRVVRRALRAGRTHHPRDSTDSRAVAGPKDNCAERFVRLWQCSDLTESLNITSIPLVPSALRGKELDGILMIRELR